MEKYGILLIDDEAAYHAMVSALLGGRGVEVAAVADSDEALAAVMRQRFALILLDIQLGADDGRELVGSLRRMRPWLADCPIVAFTTMRPAAGESYFIDRGFDGWLPKPFKAADLIALARRWLGADRVGELSEESPLAKLLGEEAAASMIERLHVHLSEAVAEIDGGADPRPVGHRVGGLAGTLGFPALSAAWLSLQDNSAAWPTVRALTLETLGGNGASRR
ncbi:response regulator [Rhizorhabdus dicambivorans]|nr:response regulator [Rhizorhabdus dicambivorans]